MQEKHKAPNNPFADRNSKIVAELQALASQELAELSLSEEPDSNRLRELSSGLLFIEQHGIKALRFVAGRKKLQNAGELAAKEFALSLYQVSERPSKEGVQLILSSGAFEHYSPSVQRAGRKALSRCGPYGLYALSMVERQTSQPSSPYESHSLKLLSSAEPSDLLESLRKFASSFNNGCEGTSLSAVFNHILDFCSEDRDRLFHIKLLAKLGNQSAFDIVQQRSQQIHKDQKFYIEQLGEFKQSEALDTLHALSESLKDPELIKSILKALAKRSEASAAEITLKIAKLTGYDSRYEEQICEALIGHADEAAQRHLRSESNLRMRFRRLENPKKIALKLLSSAAVIGAGSALDLFPVLTLLNASAAWLWAGLAIYVSFASTQNSELCGSGLYSKSSGGRINALAAIEKLPNEENNKFLQEYIQREPCRYIANKARDLIESSRWRNALKK